MSLKDSLKNTSLGLKGASLTPRDGKAIDALKSTVLTTPLSMKGATPEPTYENEINQLDPKKS